MATIIPEILTHTKKLKPIFYPILIFIIFSEQKTIRHYTRQSRY